MTVSARVGQGRAECRAQGPDSGRSNSGIWWEAATERGSRPISRVLSRATIHLGHMSPCASSDLPGSPCGPQERTRWFARFPIWSCSRWGLPCRRVLPPARCALTAPFHPYLPQPVARGTWAGLSSGQRRRNVLRHRRFAFCCTFRGLAPPRRYLAPRPVEPGLSSAKFAAVAWPTPASMIPRARHSRAALARASASS